MKEACLLFLLLKLQRSGANRYEGQDEARKPRWKKGKYCIRMSLLTSGWSLVERVRRMLCNGAFTLDRSASIVAKS